MNEPTTESIFLFIRVSATGPAMEQMINMAKYGIQENMPDSCKPKAVKMVGQEVSGLNTYL